MCVCVCVFRRNSAVRSTALRGIVSREGHVHGKTTVSGSVVNQPPDTLILLSPSSNGTIGPYGACNVDVN